MKHGKLKERFERDVALQALRCPHMSITPFGWNYSTRRPVKVCLDCHSMVGRHERRYR